MKFPVESWYFALYDRYFTYLDDWPPRRIGGVVT